MPKRKHTRLKTPQSAGKRGSIDKTFFILAIGLTILGLLSVANTSAPLASASFRDPFFFVKQQAMWAVVGLGALVIGATIPMDFFKKYSKYQFYVCVFLLLLVLIPGFGSRLLGARRWISLGPVGFQPSELIKISIALYFAGLADRSAPLKHYVWALGIVCGLIMLQPDLGTTITVVSVAFAQIFTIGFPLFQIGFIGVVGVIAAAILSLSSEYRRARLATFFLPHDDPSGVDYHVRQILIALGSGGVLGRGLGQSRQKQLFLPETATDSVFAVIAEELGFFGATAVLFLLAFFVLRAFKIARTAPDTFTQTFAVGISGWIAAQTFFNIAAMVALTPLTGIPLPFFSYGGSSLTMLLAGIGILLNISRLSKHE